MVTTDQTPLLSYPWHPCNPWFNLYSATHLWVALSIVWRYPKDTTTPDDGFTIRAVRAMLEGLSLAPLGDRKKRAYPPVTRRVSENGSV